MARLDVNVITSLTGAGLEREYLLLKDLLSEHDIYTVGVHYTHLERTPLTRADINIFLEVICPPVLNLSRENWYFPNSEWYDSRYDPYLSRFTKILCKTKNCYEIWCKKVGAEKCVYTSFEARDIYRPEIPREHKFLHVAGKSEHKNTEAVIRAWRMTRLLHMPAPPQLTIISRAPCFQESLSHLDQHPDKNIVHYQRVSDEEIIQMMNSHMFHLIPSMYEGFGHCIHEALGCGGLVITTNAPPMNSYEGILQDCVIPPCSIVSRALAHLNYVSCQQVNDAARKASQMAYSNPDLVAEKSRQAREAFLQNRKFFRDTFMGLVNSVHRS